MSAARGIALSALVIAVLLAGYLLLFRGGGGHEYTLLFQNAGQLVKGNEVRVGGQPVGSITAIELDDQANAVVTMNVGDSVAPLHQGTTATIRAASLSGITSRYISLKPGPNNANQINDGGRIGADSTTSPVDIDVLFNTLDKKTRGGLRDFIRGTGQQYDTKGEEAAQSIKYFAPFLDSTSRLTQELACSPKPACCSCSRSPPSPPVVPRPPPPSTCPSTSVRPPPVAEPPRAPPPDSIWSTMGMSAINT